MLDGTHSFAVRSVDRVTNRDQGPATWNWFIDTTAPETSIVSSDIASGAIVSNTQVTYTFSAVDTGTGVSSYECRLNTTAWSACTSPMTYTGLTDGVHAISVHAIDHFHNIDPTPATLTFTVDTISPVLTLIGS